MSRLRLWWHEKRGHKVVRSVMRDYRHHHNRYEFFFRKAWLCTKCGRSWAQ